MFLSAQQGRESLQADQLLARWAVVVGLGIFQLVQVPALALVGQVQLQVEAVGAVMWEVGWVVAVEGHSVAALVHLERQASVAQESLVVSSVVELQVEEVESLMGCGTLYLLLPRFQC